MCSLSVTARSLAGLGILLIFPQKILSVSFQLSFTAVMVLVAFCSFLLNRPWGKFTKGCIGFVGVNILVFLALSPFICYHFHLMHPYGILGNMFFNGIFSFFIMPLLFIGALLMPLGADILFFHLAGLGVNWVRLGAEKITHFPYAEIHFSDIPATALGVFSFGMMLVCFLKTPLRRLGYGLILISMGIWLFS